MKRWQRILLSTTITLFLLVAITVGLISYYFGIDVTVKGKAQGFEIGEAKITAYAKAQELNRKGDIKAIHVDPDINADNEWVLIVDPEWWNNKITLTFENDTLVEIRRDRICCELP